MFLLKHSEGKMRGVFGGRGILKRLLLCGLVLFSLFGCARFEKKWPSPDSYPVHGIDVSKFQGEIDWNAAARDGVAFAFIKATEGGDHLDARFYENWMAARQAGIPRAAYHFYYFCRPAEDQIAWFIQNVPREDGALPPVLDMEWNGHSPTCSKKFPRDMVLREMEIFLKRAEAYYGQKPIIYSSVDFHDEILKGVFKEYPFWLRSVAAHPEERYEDRSDWIFWQYTEEGRVAGIRGSVDRNLFYGSKRQWVRWKKKVLQRF